MTAVLTPRERMRRVLWRLPVDRLPVQTNLTPVMEQKLQDALGLNSTSLQRRLDNHLLRLDVNPVERQTPDGSVRFDWWGAGWDTRTEGYWNSVSPLADSKDLDRFDWPDPLAASLLDRASARLKADRGEHFSAPNFGMCLFERAWSLRGFTAFLIDLVEDPAWAGELLDRITDIQVRLARRFVALGVDGGYLGDDYGAQRGMLFSPRLWRQHFKPRLHRIVAVFRDAGLPVILHSDGDIWAILPDLAEIGVTCLNPVQPEVLEHTRLHREYGNIFTFYGGISTQSVLPAGSPDEVRAATQCCAAELAPDDTGLVLGPSHRMQSDIPVENVLAMLGAFPKGDS